MAKGWLQQNLEDPEFRHLYEKKVQNMAAHPAICVVCHAPTSCASDAYVYGCGKDTPCNGGTRVIEFCSKECFDWLKASMAERERFAATKSEED